ncbi:MAG: EAL domain-containing protein [bacterium]
MVYTFSEAMRRDYEALPIPLAFFQDMQDHALALLVTDGLCRLMKAERPQLVALLNESLMERVHPDDVGRLKRTAEQFAAHRSGYDVVYRGRYGADPDYRYIHSVARWQTMPDGTELAVFSYSDISESSGENNRLAESYALLQKDRFYTDPITGLPNINFMHEFANDRVEKLRARGATPVMLYSDINGLRSYNSQYGYGQGDELLLVVSETLCEVLNDALVARGADDHFIAIAEYRGAEWLAGRIRLINETIQSRAFGKTRGVRVGVCVFSPDMVAAEAVDRARHALKQIGTDLNVSHYFYTQASEDSYWEQRYILETFDAALKNNWIKVYYQGIMRLKTGKAAAMEALARWIDPVRGLISPGQFIPVLEKYHLLHKLDIYMVEALCREMELRQAAGLPMIPVTVNFSAQDFDYIDVVETLNQTLDRYGVSRDRIIIEITEQDLATANDQFRRQLRAIRESGYQLWLDDFGSGYSSLNVLSQYEIDLVKFDMELLRHLDDRNGANRHIMRAMVSLCRQLGIRTLSEGMETEDQLDFLQEIDCQLAQGFYYYRPQPLDDVLFRVRNRGAFINCETPEEREQYNAEWLLRMEN